MTNANDGVNGFQKALGKGDFKAARTFLDDHLKFVGPFESFDRPEPYLASLERLHHIIARVEPKKMFVDGDTSACSTIWSRTPRLVRRSSRNGIRCAATRLPQSGSSSTRAPSSRCSIA